MAKKNDKAPAAPQAMQTQGTTDLARPSWLGGERRGTEHIGRDDVQIPRLALAQALSPQLKEGDPAFIEDLRQGHMFNTVTGQVFGKGPLEFAIVRADRPRYIEFNPRESGGGIKDFNVPANDPRTQFTTNEKGERVKPVATKFYDYVVVLIPFDREAAISSIIALSMKSSQLKVARQLNTFIQQRNADLWAAKYTLTSVAEKGAKGDYANYRIANAGWVSQEEYQALGALAEILKDKTVSFDRDADDAEGGDESFDTTKM